MSSFVSRVAFGAAVSATFAALFAAVLTAGTAHYLMAQQEDHRLSDAAVVLAGELDEASNRTRSVSAIVRDEELEMQHTGIAFSVHRDGSWMAGDERLRLASPWPMNCFTQDEIRVCSARAQRGETVSAMAKPIGLGSWWMVSVGISALFAAALAWLASKPIARWLVAPLSRLEARVFAIDIAKKQIELGERDDILEIDRLRDAVQVLVRKTSSSLDQASRFASEAAHELRTPLTTLRGELELLSEGTELSSESKLDLQRAQKKVDDLQRLIERLLVLALPQSETSIDHELLSMPDLVEDFAASMPQGERERTSFEIEDFSGLVKGDASLLQTVLANALSNALKFGSQAKVHVFGDGKDLVLTVEDDGRGIRELDSVRLFEPFFRAADIRGRVQGHGIGLAIVALVVENHRGTVRFANLAKPTRLEIRLPLAP